MSVIINSVVCQELVGRLQESYSLLGGPVMTKAYLCAWQDRFRVAQGLLGLNTAVKINGLITLNAPLPYPELQTAYASEIEIVGVGPPTQGSNNVTWPNAIVYATFGALKWSFSGIDGNFAEQQIDPQTPMIYCKQNIQTSTHFKSIQGQGLVFASSGNVKQGNYALPIFQADIHLTFIRVPYLPAQAILASGLNPINSTTFLGQAAGYVLFIGTNNEGSRDTAGNMTQDLTMSFSYRTLRWDYDWDAKAAAFNQVQRAGAGVGIIGMSDLNQLIPQGYLL